jgi:PAS domain S-box-containing protein
MPERATPASAVLERILLLQSALLSTRGEGQLAQALCRGLDGIPGIGGCAVCIGGRILAGSAPERNPAWECSFIDAREDAAANCESQCAAASSQSAARLALATSRRTYGVLLIDVSGEQLYSLYQPYLATTAKLLALHIENGRQCGARSGPGEWAADQMRERAFLPERSETRPEAALPGGELWFWDWNLATGVVAVDEEAYILDARGPDARGRKLILPADEWEGLVHPDDLPPLKARLRDHLEGRTDHLLSEHRVRRESGQWNWVLWRGKVVERAQDGHPLRLRGASLDIGERKQAEDTLREQTTLLHTIVDNTTECIFITDREGRFAMANPATAAALGKPGDEILGKTAGELVTNPAAACLLAENDRLVMQSECPRPFEERFETPHGARVFLSAKAPWRTPQGEVVGVIGIARNITERDAAEAAARQWQQAFEQSAIGITLVETASFTFLAVNDAYARPRGYTPQELAGVPVAVVDSPENRGTPDAALQATLQRTGHCVFETVELRKDGSRFPALVDLTGIRDETGKVVSHVGFVLDLTARKRAESELQLQRERLTLAQQAAHFGSFDLDLVTNGLVWSEELERIYGFRPGEFKGTLEAWADCLRPEDREEQLASVANSARTGIVIAQFRIRRQDTGELRWLEARGEVYGDATGRPVRMVGVCADITERKHAEEAIHRLNFTLEHRVQQRTAQLETANRELEAFAYSVSHDLRAPLRGIDGWSLALVEDFGDRLDAQARVYLDRVRAETQRMGRLIDDLLQLSRLSRIHIAPHAVDLSQLAGTIAARLREAHPERQIEFRIGPGLRATGDQQLLEIALTNLLSNAVKFTGRRDTALVEFGREVYNGESAFYIRDNGAGFDMAHASMLFGAFQRLHRASEFPGSGIGLATVQRIVHRHEGRIWAKAQPDHGATFYFTLGLTDGLTDNPADRR